MSNPIERRKKFIQTNGEKSAEINHVWGGKIFVNTEKGKKNIWKKKLFRPNFVLVFGFVLCSNGSNNTNHRPTQTNSIVTVRVCREQVKYRSVNCNGFSVKWQPHTINDTSINLFDLCNFDLGFLSIHRFQWFARTIFKSSLFANLLRGHYKGFTVKWSQIYREKHFFFSKNSAWEKLRNQTIFITTFFWFFLFYWFFLANFAWKWSLCEAINVTVKNITKSIIWTKTNIDRLIKCASTHDLNDT